MDTTSDGKDRSAGLVRTRLFHPWAHEPEGGWSGACVSMPHVVGHRQGSGFDGLIRLGHIGFRQGTSGSRMGPYISRTSIWDSRATVGACWAISGSDGFPWEPCFWYDGTRRVSTDRSTVPYRFTIDVGAPSGPDGPPADPHRTPLNRSLPGLGGPQLLLASGLLFRYNTGHANFSKDRKGRMLLTPKLGY